MAIWNIVAGLGINLGASLLGSLFGGGVQTVSQMSERGFVETIAEPTSQYGQHIPRVFGNARVTGNMVWALLPPQERVDQWDTEQRSGNTRTITTNREAYYYGKAVWVLSEQIDGEITRIWMNELMAWERGSVEVRLGPKYFTDPNLPLNSGNVISNGLQIQRFSGLNTGNFLNDRPYGWRRRAVVEAQELWLGYFGNSYPALSVEISTEVAPRLDTILSALLTDWGFDAGEIDVTELSDIPVRGYKTTNSDSLEGHLQQLQQCFFFDYFESQGKLKFIKMKRQGAVSNLPQWAMAAHEAGGTIPDNIEVEITPEYELPSQIELTFNSITDVWYEQKTIKSAPIRTDYENLLSIKVEVTLTDSEALAIANKLLHVAWSHRKKYKFSLPPQYYYLEPGDVVEFTLGSQLAQAQITRTDHGANGLIKIEARSYDGSAFDGVWTVSAPVYYDTSATQGTPIPFPTSVEQFESVTNADGTVTYTEGVDYEYDAENGTITPIIGGGIANGSDIVINYTGDAPPYDPVGIGSPVPTTVTLEELESAGVAAFISAGNGWTSASLYLSRDGGTTYYPFTSTQVLSTSDGGGGFLTSGYYGKINLLPSDVGETLYVKAVSVGQTIDDAVADSLLITGLGLPGAITSFSPSQGDVDDIITISGYGFTGATSASINGANITGLTVVNDSTITGTIALGTTTGKIVVTVPSGTITSESDFRVVNLGFGQIGSLRYTRILGDVTIPAVGNTVIVEVEKPDIFGPNVPVMMLEIPPVAYGTGYAQLTCLSVSGNELTLQRDTKGLVTQTFFPASTSTNDTIISAIIEPTTGVYGGVPDPGSITVTIPFGGFIESPKDKTYPLFQPTESYVIQSLRIKTVSGTCTAAIQIGGVSVTGLSAVAVTSTPQLVNATALNTVAIGDRATMVISANSSAVDLEFTMMLEAV
jgi:hypothetical protein